MGRHESARPQGAWAQDFAFVWGLTFALHMQLGKVLRKEFAKLLGRLGSFEFRCGSRLSV